MTDKSKAEHQEQITQTFRCGTVVFVPEILAVTPIRGLNFDVMLRGGQIRIDYGIQDSEVQQARHAGEAQYLRANPGKADAKGMEGYADQFVEIVAQQRLKELEGARKELIAKVANHNYPQPTDEIEVAGFETVTSPWISINPINRQVEGGGPDGDAA